MVKGILIYSDPDTVGEGIKAAMDHGIDGVTRWALDSPAPLELSTEEADHRRQARSEYALPQNSPSERFLYHLTRTTSCLTLLVQAL